MMMEKKEAIEVLKPLLKDLALEPEREALQTAISCLESVGRIATEEEIRCIIIDNALKVSKQDEDHLVIPLIKTAKALVGKILKPDYEKMTNNVADIISQWKNLRAEKGKLEEENRQLRHDVDYHPKNPFPLFNQNGFRKLMDENKALREKEKERNEKDRHNKAV
jgi:hypothetical protein